MPTLEATIRRERTVERAVFSVDTHCPRCAMTLEWALRTTDGVSLAVVLPGSAEAVVDFDPAVVTMDDLVEAIGAAGIPARLISHN